MLGWEFESAEALLDWTRDEFESIRPDVLERVLTTGSLVLRNGSNMRVRTSLKTKEVSVTFLLKV
jgi:hypothetical protein